MKVDPFDSEALRRGLKKRTVRSAKVTLLSQAAIFGSQFVGGILLARALDPAVFGIVGMTIAITGFLDTFRDLGLSAATVQAKEITRRQLTSLFWINVAVGALLSGLTCAAAPVLGWFYGRADVQMVTLALSATFLISGLSAQQYAVLRRTMQFGVIARTEVAAMVLSYAFALAAAHNGWGVWSLVVQRLSRLVMTSIGLWISTGWRPGAPTWDPSTKGMLRFGGFLALNNIMNYAARNVDNIAIGKVWGAHALGLYSRAYNLLTLPLSQIGTPLAQVAIPAFSRLRDEPEKFRTSFITMQQSISMAVVPFVAALVSCAEPTILLLLGEKWREAASIYRWLAASAVTQPIATTCGILFVASGRSKEMSKSTLINSALAVISILAALPWGPVAVAASYSLSGLLLRTPILFYYSGKMTAVTSKDLLATLIPAVVLGAGIIAANQIILTSFGPFDHGIAIAVALVVAAAATGAMWLLSRRARIAVRESMSLVRAATGRN